MDEIPGPKASAPGGTVARKADDHDPVLVVLVRVKAEPRTRRAADPPVGEGLVEDRLQKIDRYHHVERDDPPAQA